MKDLSLRESLFSLVLSKMLGNTKEVCIKLNKVKYIIKAVDNELEVEEVYPHEPNYSELKETAF